MSAEPEAGPAAEDSDTGPLDTLPADLFEAANNAGRDVNGVQARVVHGGVHLTYRERQERLVRSIASERELAVARLDFVEPAGFDRAARVLAEHRVVVLCGRGSGRSCAAHRLLLDQGADPIALLNVDRPLAEAGSDEVAARHGYVWQLAGAQGPLLLDQDVLHFAGLVQVCGGWFVIVLDDERQAPAEADSWLVRLRPPDPVAVAEQAIRRQSTNQDATRTELKRSLADRLPEGVPPSKAVRAAQLARRIADGTLTRHRARAELEERVQDAVRRWAAQRGVVEHAMAFAIAVLEHSPYDEVIPHVLKLDERLRAAEVPVGKAPRPRRAFSLPKDTLLASTNAEVMERPHPVYPGLLDETVRFRREDWASAVLTYVWREHPAQHDLLWEWMCSAPVLKPFGDAVRRAICGIVADVPAHQPLKLIDGLAGTWVPAQRRELAASALIRLADEHQHRPVVQQVLDDWITNGNVRKKWTAAVVYGSVYGRLDVTTTMAKLDILARSTLLTPRRGVRVGLLCMLIDPICWGPIADQLLAWSTGHSTGPRELAHSLALYLAGFRHLAGFDPTTFHQRHPTQLGTLVRRALSSPDTGPMAVKRLDELAMAAQVDNSAADDLIRIALLLTPDLRWWARWPAALRLARWHPKSLANLLWALNEAHRLRRRRMSSPRK